MNPDLLLEQANEFRRSGHQEQGIRLLQNAIESNKGHLAIGLTLCQWLLEDGQMSLAYAGLCQLWNHTKNEMVGDAMAELGQMAINQSLGIQKQDEGLIYRLAAILHALHGQKGLLIDALQYDIIGGLAIDGWKLPLIQEFGWFQRTGKDLVFFAGQNANPALVEMIADHLPVACDPNFPKLMPLTTYDWSKSRYTLKEEFSQKFWGRHAHLFQDWVELDHSTNGARYVQSGEQQTILNAKKLELKFKDDQKQLGRDFLKSLGIGTQDWYVCIYARDGAYYGEDPHSRNWFRNSDIRTFHLAIQEIVNRGGHVIRIGEKTNQSLEFNHPKVFDYSQSGQRTPLLDLYLMANCRFLLGTPSGLCHVAFLFDRPELMVNTVNICNIRSCDLYLPKLPISASRGELIPLGTALEKIYSSGQIGDYFENGINQIQRLDLAYRDNSAMEIAEATTEMLDRLDGSFQSTPLAQNLRQQMNQIWSKWNPSMQDPLMADSFLTRYPHLIQ